LKKYYFYTLIFAIIIATGIFLYLASKPAIFKSSGEFFLLNLSGIIAEGKNSYADETLNRTITESIKTRFFIKKLYSDAGVELPESEMNNIGDIIDAEVVEGSNILKVSLYSKDKDDLKKLNSVFFSSLKNSEIFSVGKTENQIKIVEPFYTDEDAVSPEILKYSGIAFLAVLLIGILLVYTFYLPDYYKFLSD